MSKNSHLYLIFLILDISKSMLLYFGLLIIYLQTLFNVKTLFIILDISHSIEILA